MSKVSTVGLDSAIITVKGRKVSLEHVLLAVILLFGLFLRLYDLGAQPFWIDESISALVSQTILEKGLPILDSGWFYGSAFVYHYTEAIFLLVLGHNDFAARVPSVIFGILTVFLAYLFGKEHSRAGGLMAAALCAIFFLEVSYSRQARFYQLFQLAFFATIYFVYRALKAKDDKKATTRSIYAAALSFIIAVDTQIAGVMLAPLFIWYFKDRLSSAFNSLMKNKLILFIAIVSGMIVLYKLSGAASIPVGSLDSFVHKAAAYASDITVRTYLIPFAVAGMVWAFLKNKSLTSMIMLPCILLVITVLSIDLYATRYMYFLMFPLVLFLALLFAFLYERFGKAMLLPFVFLLLVPSNVFFPATFSNAILPFGLDYTDTSMPRIDMRSLPAGLLADLRDQDATIVTYFSPPVEWYIRKPDYVVPFSMTGRGADEISYNASGTFVSRYTGAPILNVSQGLPSKPYYLIEQDFVTAKLVPWQQEDLNILKGNCTTEFENQDVNVYRCG